MATIYRTRYQFQDTSGGPIGLLTYYWDSAGATPAALVTEAHARVRAAWAALSTVIASGSTLAFTFPAADEIEETTGQIVAQQVGTLPSAVTFTSTGDLLPRSTQALVRFQTGTFVNGRRLQGHQFIPGWTENSNSGLAALQPSATGALANYNLALGTTVVTAMNQRVWHRPGGVAPGQSAIVSSRTVSGQWATLKSRRT